MRLDPLTLPTGELNLIRPPQDWERLPARPIPPGRGAVPSSAAPSPAPSSAPSSATPPAAPTTSLPPSSPRSAIERVLTAAAYQGPAAPAAGVIIAGSPVPAPGPSPSSSSPPLLAAVAGGATHPSRRRRPAAPRRSSTATVKSAECHRKDVEGGRSPGTGSTRRRCYHRRQSRPGPGPGTGPHAYSRLFLFPMLAPRRHRCCSCPPRSCCLSQRSFSYHYSRGSGGGSLWRASSVRRAWWQHQRERQRRCRCRCLCHTNLQQKNHTFEGGKGR